MSANATIRHTRFCLLAAICVLTLPIALRGQAQPDPLRGLDTALRDLAHGVTPSVVEVRAVVYSSNKDDDDQPVDKAGPETVTGSGVIMDARGFLITNAHVVDGAISVAVNVDGCAVKRHQPTNHDMTVPAKIVGLFREADLAVLKINCGTLSPIRRDRIDDVKQGELVAAFGSPAGLHHSISLGIVSSVARQIYHDDHISYIQTDAAINHGSSGGPLVDIDGNLVGITTRFFSEGGGNEGLGFAIPAKIVVYAFNEILEHGKVSWAESGIRVQDVSQTLARAMRLNVDYGVLIADLVPGSSAERAGLQPGDVITSVDGEHLDDVPHYFEHMYRKHVGDNVAISFTRGGKNMTKEFTLSSDMADASADGAIEPDSGRVPRLGIICSQLAKSQIEKSHLRSHAGILVQSRANGSDLKSDLARGDVIRSVNRTPVSTVDEVRSLLEKIRPGTPVVLQIERNGQLLWLVASDRDQSVYSEEPE